MKSHRTITFLIPNLYAALTGAAAQECGFEVEEADIAVFPQ